METERNARKEAAEQRKQAQQFASLCNALQQRAIKFDDQKKGQGISKELLRPKFLPLEDHSVHLDAEDNGVLMWPAAFSYPEFLFSDFQQQLPETAVYVAFYAFCNYSLLIEL